MRPSVVLLGLGKMGSSMAMRLREKGHAISIWNRSAAKAEAVRAIDLPGGCAIGETASLAIGASTDDSAVLLMLSNTAACLHMINEVRGKLRGRTVVNLTSGNPDEGRQIEAVLAAPELGVGAYIDGAYCGAPSKARQGAGTLFLSSESSAEVERLTPTLGLLGEVAFCGRVGSSRAIDYAVVDLALVCYNSFLSNAEMLEREGVHPPQLYEHMAKRLATVSGAVELMHGKLTDRTDESYHVNQVVSLETLHGFWTSRLPYFEANGIPSHFARAMADMCERAAGDGAHWGADVSRLQELMRPPPRRKRGRGDQGDQGDKQSEHSAAAASALESARAFAAHGRARCTVDFQVVDVFTRGTYAGNPTCVCFPPSGVGDAWMAKVARETSQPTTSFVDEPGKSFRTFSASGLEMPLLSGHSSLGIAAALTARTGTASHVLSSMYGNVTLTCAGAAD